MFVVIVVLVMMVLLLRTVIIRLVVIHARGHVNVREEDGGNDGGNHRYEK